MSIESRIEKLTDVVDEYLHWRKVNPHIKGGENYLKRLRDASTPPVSVEPTSLEDVFNKVILAGLYHNELFDPAEEYYKKIIATVLDSAGVKYVG